MCECRSMLEWVETVSMRCLPCLLALLVIAARRLVHVLARKPHLAAREIEEALLVRKQRRGDLAGRVADFRQCVEGLPPDFRHAIVVGGAGTAARAQCLAQRMRQRMILHVA